MDCDFCAKNRAIMEFGITYMGQAAKLRTCALCSGIAPDPDDPQYPIHVSLETIIYKLQDKTARLENERTAPPPSSSQQ